MKICVIGGSGFVGSHLVPKLRDEFEVSIIDKNINDDFRDITLKGDIRNKELLVQALDGIDLVIHLAAEHKDNVDPIDLYYDVNVRGTRNILDAMRIKNIGNIIFTSTVAIYGLNKDNPDEQRDPDPFNHYGKSKYEAEIELGKWYEQQDGRALTIIRPTVIFGEDNRGNVYNLLKQIASGRFIMVGDGKNKKSLAYVGNVVSFIEHVIRNRLSGFEVFNYADKPDLTTNELIETVEDNLSVSIPNIRVPYMIGMAGGFLFDALSKLTGKKFPISSIRVKKFCATTQFNAEKAHTSDFTPPYTITEGLKRTLNYDFK